MRYLLDDNGNPTPCNDLLEWARKLDNAMRRVAEDTIGDVYISTVFLGISYQFGDGPPLLFETMIFGGDRDGYQEHYSTRADALAGHARAVALVSGTPEDGTTDIDEERPRSRRLTRTERHELAADAGKDTVEDFEETR